MTVNLFVVHTVSHTTVSSISTIYNYGIVTPVAAVRMALIGVTRPWNIYQ